MAEVIALLEKQQEARKEAEQRG
jgi:hypothetical protein